MKNPPDKLQGKSSNKTTKALNVLAPSIVPELSRVRLFINEIAASFFRVISLKFNPISPHLSESIKENITALRELGQEFIALSSDRAQQELKAQQLRKKVAQVFFIDTSVDQMSSDAQFAVVKCFQLFLYLIEEAQKAERELRGRHRLEKNPLALDPLLENAITQFSAGNQVQQALRELKISFVFTKHPTTIKYAQMHHALKRVFRHFARSDWTLFYPEKSQRSFSSGIAENYIDLFRSDLDALILEAWSLPVIRPLKPSVRSEVEEGYIELRDDILPEMSIVRDSILSRGFDLAANPIWRIKQWFGFDVDGHPFVDKHSCAAALFLNNVRFVVDLFDQFNELVALLPRQIKKSLFVDISNRLQATAYEAAVKFNKLIIASNLVRDFWYEPELKNFLALSNGAAPFNAASECIDRISEICSSVKCGKHFDRWIGKLSTSGFKLATGMFRENSKVLEYIFKSVIPDYLPHANIDQAASKQALQLRQNEEMLAKFFSHAEALNTIKRKLAVKQNDDLDLSLNSKAQQTINTIEFLAQAQEILGLESINEFILSLTENRAQIKGYAALLKACGVKSKSRIIPLFEEFESLVRIDQILREIFSDKVMVEQLQGEDGIITIFLGMSDGQKTTGPFFPYIAAEAEEKIIEVAARYKLEVRVFHGIGSSQARGQDRHPDREYAARPSLQVAPYIERTIQGEAIQRLRHQDLSKHVGAIIYNYLKRQNSVELSQDAKLELKKRELINQISAIAQKEFVKLTLSREFSYFLGHFSPALDSLNPASRPNNRSAKQNVDLYRCDFEDLRAVPANYQDIQAQSLISTWYGAADAFATADKIMEAQENFSLHQLYSRQSEQFDPRFHKNVHFMIEAIASSGLDVTNAMLQTRLEVVDDQRVANYLKHVMLKLQQEQVDVVDQLEKFVPRDNSAQSSDSPRSRATAMLANPLLAEDIQRRLPYITVLSFIAAQGMNTYDKFRNTQPGFANFGLEIAKIAACGKANGYGQVG